MIQEACQRITGDIMDCIDDFFRTFPVESEEWEQRLRKFLKLNSQLCNQILTAVKPTLKDSLPARENVFAALRYNTPSSVRAVIVGQDPYPTPGDAHGLCFSVEHGKPPASLRNIFKEIQRDFGGDLRTNANLTDLAKQQVLLLNSSLTVLPRQASSHSKIGWQEITSFIAKTVWVESPHSIFLLWGNHAKKLIQPIPKNTQRVLQAGHPSPLAYGRNTPNNFKGCGHFKKTNQLLLGNGITPIVWHERDTLLDFIMA